MATQTVSSIFSCSIPLNFNYLASLFGILKVFQILFSLITCCCVSRGVCWNYGSRADTTECSGQDYSIPNAHGQYFLVLCGSLAIICSSVFLFLHLFGFIEGCLARAPWRIIEICFCCVMTILVLISSIVETYYSARPEKNMYQTESNTDAWKAAAVFCWLSFAVYSIEFILFLLLSWDSISEVLCCRRKSKHANSETCQQRNTQQEETSVKSCYSSCSDL